MHQKRNNEDTSLRGMVSRAFGPRPSRQDDDSVPELGRVLTQLDISSQENDPGYEINRIDFPADTAAPHQELEAHRRRLEQLLEDARRIEDLLSQEAAQARSLSENLKLDEKRAALAEAAENEEKALAEARGYAQNSETAARHHAKVDGELAAAREQLRKADESVKQLQVQLRDAQELSALSKAKVLENQARSEEAAKRSDLAKALTRDAEMRVAKCREAREAAQAEAAQAQEIANSIALTTETLQRIRRLGSTK